MRQIFALLLGIFLFSSAFAQNKKPLYQDDVLLVYKNCLSVRVPVLYYGYHLYSKTYEEKYKPILIGARYERLIKSNIAITIEAELNSWRPLAPNLTDAERLNSKKPEKEQTFKFSPMAKIYFRNRSNVKKFFRGPSLSIGPSFMSITEKPNAYNKRLNKYTYDKDQAFGLGFAPGYQTIIFDNISIGGSFEVLLSSTQYNQEGYIKSDIGTAATLFINPFKFYIGAAF
jgi:hypothetical protein